MGEAAFGALLVAPECKNELTFGAGYVAFSGFPLLASGIVSCSHYGFPFGPIRKGNETDMSNRSEGIESFLGNRAEDPAIFRLVQREIVFVQTLFAPTDAQFQRNLRSIRSLGSYISRFGCTSSEFHFAGWGDDDLIRKLEEEISLIFAEKNFQIHLFDRNYGKAHVVNEVTKKLSNKNDDSLLFLCDSDIIFDQDCEYIFDRIVDVVTLIDGLFGKTFGLLALDQREANCHLPTARENSYSLRSWYGTEELKWPAKPSGIAGGALVTTLNAWRAVGGYRQMGVYAGDDAFFLLDIGNAGFSYQLVETLWVVHPYDHDRDYALWKQEVCARDSAGIVADQGLSLGESEKFWKSRLRADGRLNETTKPDRAPGPSSGFALVSWHGTVCTFGSRGSVLKHEYIPELSDDREVVVVGSSDDAPNTLDRCLTRPVGESIVETVPGLVDDSIGVRLNGTYLSAEPGGVLRTDLAHLREWESFFPVPAENLLAIKELLRADWISSHDLIRLGGRDIVRKLVSVGDDRIKPQSLSLDFSLAMEKSERRAQTDRVDVVREGWKRERFDRFRPLIYFVVCGHGLLDQFRLAIDSLWNFANYRDEVLIITDIDDKFIFEHIPENMKEKCFTKRIVVSDYLDVVCSRLSICNFSDLVEYQPVIYSDLDVIFDAPVESILIEILNAEGFDAQTEGDGPAREKESTGARFFADDNLLGYEDCGFNSGILGIPGMRRWGRELNLILNAVAEFVERRGRESLAGREQYIANYILAKTRMFVPRVVHRSTWVPMDRLDPSGSRRKGFVHFWPFGAERTAAMSRYLDVLRTQTN